MLTPGQHADMRFQRIVGTRFSDVLFNKPQQAIP
jgi:hypothetical protein